MLGLQIDKNVIRSRGIQALNLKKLSIEEFVKEIKRAGEADPDHRYTLFLGAGCSKSSGIPTAGELVLERWIPDQVSSGEDPIEWAKANIKGFDRNDPAASYGAVIEQCFTYPKVRQAEIERICEVASPGFGYSVVAQLCAQNNTPFSVVLTTNFDDLVADAMFLYAESRPLIIHHAALAEYIRPTRSRPMVVKVHGDARLAPKNTALETEEIEQAMRQQVKKLLDDRGLIFFGYAGADDSVFNMLAELPSNALDLGVYWINKNLPASEKFRNWLKERQATWVRYTDFDEAMLHFYRAYNLAPPTKDRFDRIFDMWEGQFGELESRIYAKPDEDQDKARLTAETRAVRSSIDAWRSVNEILAMDKQDPDAILSAYQTAVREHPGFAPLLNNYALFLTDVRGDHDAAKTFYKRAIEADPKDANILSNYANFLTDVRGDHDAAETFYKRAIEADPKDANILSNYANFLTDVRGDHDTAATFYKRAIDANPKHANNLGNYAIFLKDVRGDHDKAETLYKRAIDADPKHANILGNYGEFLLYRSEHERGFGFLDRSDKVAKDKGDFNRMAENDICRAIYSAGTDRRAALSRLHRSLRAIKVPCPSWSQCKQEHRLFAATVSDRKWLAKLFDVFEGKARIEELDEWPEWREAGSDMRRQ